MNRTTDEKFMFQYFISLTIEELMKVEGFGKVSASSFIESRDSQMDEILKLGHVLGFINDNLQKELDKILKKKQ